MDDSDRKDVKDLIRGSQDYFEISCDPCQEVEGNISKAEGFCSNCNEYLCISCLKPHGLRKRTKNHKVLRGDDMPLSRLPEKNSDINDDINLDEECTDKCQKHCGQDVRYFCKRHSCLGCMDCVALEHTSCGSYIVLIANIVSEDSTDIAFNKFTEKLSQLNDRFQHSTQKANNHIKYAALQSERAIQDASRFHKMLTKKLNVAKAEVQRKAREKNAETRSKIQTVLNQNDELMKEILQIMINFQRLGKCQRRIQQFTLMLRMQSRLQELEKLSVEIKQHNCIEIYNFEPRKELETVLAGETSIGDLVPGSNPGLCMFRSVNAGHSMRPNIPPTDVPSEQFSEDQLIYICYIRGIKVIIYHGNLIKEHTDVIVNATNEDLEHLSGIAYAIQRARGRAMEEECREYKRKHGRLNTTEVMKTSGGGEIKATHIFHAAGPLWLGEGSKERVSGQLTQTFLNCFQLAEQLFQQSIALPAIGTGVYGVPLDTCVSSFLDAILIFTHAPNGIRHVRDIRLLNFDAEKAVISITLMKALLEEDLAGLTKAALARRFEFTDQGAGLNLPRGRPVRSRCFSKAYTKPISTDESIHKTGADSPDRRGSSSVD